MDPEKPVTKDLVARGFGRDIMGLLLAWREREIVGRYQSLKFYNRKITVAQAQEIIDIAESHLDFQFCDDCDTVTYIKIDETFNLCMWCCKEFCVTCQDLREVHVCNDCKSSCVDWCPECGLADCPRANICRSCQYNSCATHSKCTRCALLDSKGLGNYPFTNQRRDSHRWHNKEHLAQVCARLGIKPAQ